MLGCRGADDDAIGPLIEQRPSRVHRSNPSAHLDGDVDRREESRDGAGVAPHAVARAVEIDHVQALSALGLPVAGHFGGIFAVRRLPGEIALNQLDAPPGADINRRNGLEACHVLLRAPRCDRSCGTA